MLLLFISPPGLSLAHEGKPVSQVRRSFFHVMDNHKGMPTLLIKGVKAKTTTLASCSLLEGFLGPEREREMRSIIICHTNQAGKS